MDPLSIIASTITVAGLLRVTIGKARAIKRGQTNIQALASESSALMIVLLDIEKCIVPTATMTSLQSPELLQRLNVCRNRLSYLVERLSLWVGDSETILANAETVAFRRLRVAAKHRDFCNEMILLRHELSTILMGISVSSSSQITHEIQELRLTSEDAMLRQQEFFEETAKSNDAQLGQLTALGEQLSLLHRNTRTIASRSLFGTESMYEGNDRRMTDNTKGGHVRAFPHNGSILFDSPQMSAVAAVGIRTAQFRRSACRSWCACQCHNVKQWRSVHVLGDYIGCVYIGCVYIGFSGIPRLRRECDRNDCRLPSQPVACATYFFPPWLLDRAISLVLSSTPMAGPVASLKTNRTVPDDASVFTYAKLGDIGKMKSLFERQLASPHDVSYRSGVTALHIAINYQQIDMCRFLLTANADPFTEDRSTWSPSDGAWTKILFQSFEPEAESQLRDMFTDTDCLERRGLTVLHRIVLGLVDLDLGTYLEASSVNDIDCTDVSGRTAVLMAAGRDDSRAVNLLLHHRANPNITSPGEGSPLHVAAIARSGNCLQLLLQQHADVKMTTSYKQTALHYVAAYKNDEERARTLIDAGADLNARDLEGITPFQWAVVADKGRVANILIKEGADLCNVDKYGRTAFLQAITANRHVILDLILRSGIPVSDLQGTSRSLLQNISESADIKTIELLHSNIGPVLSNAKERDVVVALEVVASRPDTSPELTKAFAGLLSTHTSFTKDNMQAEADATKAGKNALTDSSLMELPSFGQEKRRMSDRKMTCSSEGGFGVTSLAKDVSFSSTFSNQSFPFDKGLKRLLLVVATIAGLLYLMFGTKQLSSPY